MKRAAVFLAAVAVSLAACSPSGDSPLDPSFQLNPTPGGIARVTTNADAGPGSFREAIEAANGDGSIGKILFDPQVGTVALQQPVVYSGSQALDIQGHGVVVDGDALAAGQNALTANGGGDLTIQQMTVQNAPGVGIVVAVPGSATGEVRVTLADVHALDNGLHGVLINDQAEYFTDPASTSQEGSAAGLLVVVRNSSFERNGLTLIDQDGLRINEGGLGDLVARIEGTLVAGNGGDGIEFDERAAGSAVFTVRNTALLGNGPFTAADFDDGIDVDEAGPGDIQGEFTQVKANDNFEQGIDLNENDAGDLKIVMHGVEALRNLQEGIEFEEDDDFAGGGNIEAWLTNITANGNLGGDAGLKLREKGVGNLVATIRNVEASGNTVGGILVREDAAGDLTATIGNATTLGNTLDGIKFDENSSGDLDAELVNATSSNNTGAGVRAEQATTGSGVLRITALTATANGGGAVSNDAGMVVQGGVLP